MKSVLIAVVVLLCLQAVNAKPNGEKGESTTTATKSLGDGGQGSAETKTVSTSDASGNQVTSTTTIISSSSSSSTTIGGIIDSNFTNGCDDDDGCDDCECVPHLYEAEDLRFVDSTDSVTNFTQKQCKNCEIQLNILDSENDQLRKQLKCVTKKLQTALDDNTNLKTSLIAANADTQNWKTKSDSLEIDLKKAVDTNAQLTTTVNEYTTTITNLRLTLNETTNKSNQCAIDSDEWRRKWEAENATVIQNEKQIKESEATNVDLKTRITKLNDDLSSCQIVNQKNDVEINTLKTTVTDLTKQLSNCTVDLGTCNVALKRVTDDFNADELSEHEKEKLRTKLELQLGECTNRTTDIENDLESERKSVTDCKQEIVTNRDECAKRNQKYEDDITALKLDQKASIDKCEASLKLEKDDNANLRIDINRFQKNITDCEDNLATSIKTSDDWQKKSNSCNDDAVTLKQTIDTLRTNLGDTNKQLSTCVANGNSLQSELSSCKSKLDICNGDLSGTKQKLSDSDVVIAKLNVNITSLETAKNGCLNELSTLRCDTNQLLGNVKTAEEKVNDALLQAISFLDGNKKFLSNFTGSHDLTCKP